MKHRPHTDRRTPPSAAELQFARRHIEEMVETGAVDVDEGFARLSSLEVWADFRDDRHKPLPFEFTDLCLWGAFRPMSGGYIVVLVDDDDDADEGDDEMGANPPPNVDYRALPPGCGARFRRFAAHRSRGCDRRKLTARATR